MPLAARCNAHRRLPVEPPMVTSLVVAPPVAVEPLPGTATSTAGIPPRHPLATFDQVKVST